VTAREAGGGPRVRLLFVCLGNICRSPTAEGVMRVLLEREGLDGTIELDSAGTGSWHIGSAPDSRARAAARRRDIELLGRARQVTNEDFDHYDLLVAMDSDNERELRAMARDEAQRAKVRRLREFDPASASAGELDVPDPYYGAPGGFEEVLDIVQAGCEGLLAELRAESLSFRLELGDSAERSVELRSRLFADRATRRGQGARTSKSRVGPRNGCDDLFSCEKDAAVLGFSPRW